MLIIIYVVVVSIVLNEGYQSFDLVSGAISTKVKGVGLARHNTTGEILYLDANDMTRPPMESNALFVATSFVKTYQSQGMSQETSLFASVRLFN